jgi:menaquinol-cytochrome c reductase iron-sulfur subunit
MDKPKKENQVSRRKFLGTTGKAIAGSVALLSGIGTLTACTTKKSNQKKVTESGSLVLLGEEKEFVSITEPVRVDYNTEIKDGWTKQKVQGFVYITKDETNQLLIMSSICTHLGCTVPFVSEEEKKSKPGLTFLCPCHRGEYNEKGVNIGGPPPRPLDIFQPIIQDGNVYINAFSPVRRSE